MTRRTLFWIVFVGAAGIVAAVPEFMEETPEVVGPGKQRLAQLRAPEAGVTERRAESAPRAAGSAEAGSSDLPLERLESRRGEAAGKDVFSPKSWYVPPPVKPAPLPPPPPPPPPPSAPPLPFQFLGKLDDARQLKVFLQRGERIHTVGVGDVIDNTYRVESITDTQMTLIYLPLDIRQTLSVGSKL